MIGWWHYYHKFKQKFLRLLFSVQHSSLSLSYD
jgi:hypothetical protein